MDAEQLALFPAPRPVPRCERCHSAEHRTPSWPSYDEAYWPSWPAPDEAEQLCLDLNLPAATSSR